MGKQINYWMDYDNFLLVAQKAVDLGCTVIKQDLTSGKVTISKDVRIITGDKKPIPTHYYFHLLEAGDVTIQTIGGKEFLDTGFTSAVIEAGYSHMINEPTGVCQNRRKKEIYRARMYCSGGYYNEREIFIKRPDCLTKVYQSLVRFVKKIAPYTEVTTAEGKYKVYITNTCLELVNIEGYQLNFY